MGQPYLWNVLWKMSYKEFLCACNAEIISQNKDLQFHQEMTNADYEQRCQEMGMSKPPRTRLSRIRQCLRAIEQCTEDLKIQPREYKIIKKKTLNSVKKMREARKKGLIILREENILIKLGFWKKNPSYKRVGFPLKTDYTIIANLDLTQIKTMVDLKSALRIVQTTFKRYRVKLRLRKKEYHETKRHLKRVVQIAKNLMVMQQAGIINDRVHAFN